MKNKQTKKTYQDKKNKNKNKKTTTKIRFLKTYV